MQPDLKLKISDIAESHAQRANENGIFPLLPDQDFGHRPKDALCRAPLEKMDHFVDTCLSAALSSAGSPDFI